MSTMFHHTHQSAAASSRRLTNDDRPKIDRPAYFFHPYNNEGGAAAAAAGGGVGIRARSVGDAVDFGRYSASSYQQRPSNHGGSRWEMRAEEERGHDDDDEIHDVYEDLDDDDDDDDDDGDEQEPMDIMYEREVQQQLGHHYRHNRHDDNHHLRRQSEPIVGSPSSARDGGIDGAAPDDLDLPLSMSADHLVALLQREDAHYSTPLPVRYYPTEFTEEEEAPTSSSSSSSDDVGAVVGDDGAGSSSSAPRRSSSSAATIGPWRKRIASWMYDVVDHFNYDRNAVSIALSYIDRHVGHVLVENDRNNRRRRGGTGAGDGGGGDAGGCSSGGQQRGEPPIKRRHFQLIAVTCLYLAIKVHGELMEDDPVTGEAYDVVSSLVHEVDGRAFAGARGDDEGMIEEEDGGRAGDDEDCDDDLRAMSRKIADLTRRHRLGRWGSRLGQFGLPLSDRGGSSYSAETAPRTASAPPTSASSSSRVPAAPYSSLPYKPRKRGMLSGPLRLTSFVELSRGLFTARDIVETEMRVLVSMNYVVNPPTSRRFVGELLRMMALCYCGAAAATADGSRRARSAEAAAAHAERAVGLDRREILGAVLGNARRQIEGAAAVPALSMGCLPSVVAYGAMLNAVEEEFEKVASSAMETDRVDDSPQLEDYQRHYRRFSRSQSSGGGGGGGVASWSPARARRPSDRELFLEAWKEQFLAAAYHATGGILSPDSDDIFRVRELLLDQAKPATGAGAQSSAATAAAPATTTSPTEGPKSDASKTRRSPRSPRSVIFPNPRMLRGGSFFRQNSGALSPYDDARGRSPLSFRSLSGSVATATAALPHRMYHKQTSEPIAEVHAASGGGGMQPGAGGRFTRAQTPDFSVFQNDASRRGNGSNYEADSWRESTGAAFQPANPNPPLFFSA